MTQTDYGHRCRACELHLCQDCTLARYLVDHQIKIRAERRAGEMLKKAEKNEGGRPTENPSHDATGFIPPTLTELGISKDQSSRWQLEAEIPKLSEVLRELDNEGLTI